MENTRLQAIKEIVERATEVQGKEQAERLEKILHYMGDNQVFAMYVEIFDHAVGERNSLEVL